jgi:hypothetical protein
MKTTIVAVSAALFLLTSLTAHATEVEVSTPVQVTPVGAFAAYNPTGIVINTSGTNYMYLYAQGGGLPNQDTNCPLQGDKIIAYRAALDANGNPLSFSRIGRITPCVYDPESGNGMTTPASFAPGQIFQATVNGVTAYHVLADVSNAVNTFHKIWHGWTTDGENWTWEIGNAHYVSPITNPESFADPVQHTVTSTTAGPFLQVQESNGSYPFSILGPVMLSTRPLTSNASWWGYLNLDDGIFEVTEILVDWSTGSPRIQYLTDGSFDFSNYLTNGVITSSPYPYYLIPRAGVKSLIIDAASGETQLWGGVNYTASGSCNYPYSASTADCNTATMVMCNQSGGCPTAGGTLVADNASANAFQVNTIGTSIPNPCGEGFNWWAVTRFSIGATNTMYSETRYMPSGYLGAREYPFRWNSSGGTRYLFSATADNNVCSKLLFSYYYLMYVVESTVQMQ